MISEPFKYRSPWSVLILFLWSVIHQSVNHIIVGFFCHLCTAKIFSIIHNLLPVCQLWFLLLCFSRLCLSGLGLCLHFLLFLLCLLCLLLHEILDVPSGFFIKAVVTVIHNYGTFFTENHIGCSCPILLMFHQKPFLFVHQDIILCKPCPFLSFDFVPGRINGKSGIGRTFDCEKFRNDDKTIFVDIVSCGFSIIGNDDHIAATDGMTFEVLRSLLL